jgi:single-strand DNA-binding protein
LNEAKVSGTLTKDPIITPTTNSKVAKFSLKVKRDGFKGYDYPQIDAWGELAELCGSFKSGDEIEVCGATRTGSYTNRAGQKVYYQNISANEIKLLAESEEPEEPLMQEIDEDLPF